MITQHNSNNNKDLTIIFIGKGIFSTRIASDKNFLIDLVDELNKININCIFLSIAHKPLPGSIPESKNFYFIPRAFHSYEKHSYWYNNNGKLIAHYHLHNPLQEFFEITLTLILNIHKFRKLINELSGTVVIQWMDFNIITPILKLVFGRKNKYVISNLRYVPSNIFIEKLKIFCLNYADAVIVGTQAMQNTLIKLGCKCKIIDTSSWGIKDTCETNEIINKKKEKENIKLLWSGFIQQIGINDFIASVNFAKDIVQHRKDIHFSFIFKPETFKMEFKKYEGTNITIRKASGIFIDEIKNHDAFFCPSVNKNTSFAPPLTWIEALACGKPIITTKTLGIEELITDKKSGYIFENWEEMKKWFLGRSLYTDIINSKVHARDKFLSKYDIRIIAERYNNLYERLIIDKLQS